MSSSRAAERQEAQHAPAVRGHARLLPRREGLEWEAVFLIGVSEGLLPISHADTPEGIEEERRLLYVGVTRAKTHLYVSYAKQRPSGRSTRTRTRFLDGIWPEPTVDPKTQPRRRRRTRAEDLVREADADPELFERLRQWRARVAEEVNKPAFTVLHDATLASIASVEPTTLRQLALIRGIGPSKLDQFGPQILAVVRGEDPAE